VELLSQISLDSTEPANRSKSALVNQTIFQKYAWKSSKQVGRTFEVERKEKEAATLIEDTQE
jgi:hypothetical protein